MRKPRTMLKKWKKKSACYELIGGSEGKESACNAGDLGLIPGLGRSPGEGKGYPLQYSGLENSMDCIVHGVAKSRTWLSNFHFILQSHFFRLHIYICMLKLKMSVKHVSFEMVFVFVSSWIGTCFIFLYWCLPSSGKAIHPPPMI